MRRELKYLVREADREWLHRRLEPFVVPDINASEVEGRHRYVVRSAYLDTPGLRDFHEKEMGILRRRKLRVRAYDTQTSDSSVFLEIKHKREAVVWKDRAVLPAATVAAMLSGVSLRREIPRSQADAAGRFLFRLRSESRRPTLLVAYDREPLVGRFDPSLRVTFDRRLRCAPYPVLGPDLHGLFDERRVRPMAPEHFILEVKFDRLFPSWLRPILAQRSMKQQALSKYTLGLRAAAEAAPWRVRGGAAVRSLAQFGIER
ncbi:MAG: VTC domain-containing protein [Longimicrobiales bacterium]